MKRTLSIIIIVSFFISCSTTKLSLNRAIYFQKNLNTNIYLNNFENPINLDSTYLDRRNIDNIKFDRQSNSITIFQKNQKAEIFSLSEIDLESLSSSSKIDLIVLNGHLMDKKDLKNIKIESTAVKNISILKGDDLHIHSGDSIFKAQLIISTKK